jgi:hypothetical protein
MRQLLQHRFNLRNTPFTRVAQSEAMRFLIALSILVLAFALDAGANHGRYSETAFRGAKGASDEVNGLLDYWIYRPIRR